MATATVTTLSVTLVRDSEGRVDESATLDACSDALREYVSNHEQETVKIAQVVNALFDTNKGARLNMPYIQGATLPLLGVTPANHKHLMLAVAQYVRDNAGEREEGKTFNIAKGKNGGTHRWCDVKETPAKS